MNRDKRERAREDERYRSFENPNYPQRQYSRGDGSGHHAMNRDDQGGSRPWSLGGEYLRDTPVHREGRPDVEFEEAHSGDYADNVVGGDYLRSYGDMNGEQPGADLYSQDRDTGPQDYSRTRSYSQRPNYGDEKRRAPYRGERHAEDRSFGHIFRGEHVRYNEDSRMRGHRGKSPKGYLRSDDRICEDLNERLTDDDSIDPSEISVEVKDGIVTLSGSVEQRWMKHHAEDIADACSGVKDVVNQLQVNRGTNAR